MMLRYAGMEKENMEKQLAGSVAAGEIIASVLTDTIKKKKIRPSMTKHIIVKVRVTIMEQIWLKTVCGYHL
jgi:hypothetical protein